MLLAESLLGSSSAAANYIEDVFSTYLYTGNGSTQTITNGIDLSGKGGLVWLKSRSAATDHRLFDTARGAGKGLTTNTTEAESNYGASGVSFNATGFNLGTASGTNANAATYVSWTFRKQPKFFDVVTYTGNGTAGRTVSHNLGSVPGCIIVKRTSADADWAVYHKEIGPNFSTKLNASDAPVENSQYWNNTSPTATQFTVGIGAETNANSSTYVAYLFADNAGGFGASGTDNVITCGSFTTDGGAGTATVTLGYEPQFILLRSTVVSDWMMYDAMRGWFNPSGSNRLLANSSGAEGAVPRGYPTSTGFYANNLNLGEKYIYIAIRRGPMKTPTTGTSVFGLSARTGTGANATVTGGQTDDAILVKNRGSAVASLFSSRLTGTGYLVTSSEAAEVAAGTTILQANPWDVMDGVKLGTTSTITNASANTFINYLFRRAPGFFDVVCYTGTGDARTINHNLGIAPEIYIVKPRTTALASNAWWVNCAYLPTPSDDSLVLNSAGANNTGNGALLWNSTRPTSTVFSIGTYNGVNTSDTTFVAYLFATVAGVSKVGSYTGTGTTKQIDCGFTGGARFVLIKRTDSTGDWYVWDSARGIVAGNDPYLRLNASAAEVTTTDYIDTYSAGFEISSTAPAAINANGGTYIFLAIA